MKANELRLCNLVLFDGEIKKINTVDITYQEYWLNHKGENSLKPEEKLQPIPLTKEWLLKFGFIWRGVIGKSRFLTNYTPCGKAIVVKDGYIIFSGVTIEIKIKHVHQLQNLYFALTGEELKIN